MTQNFSSVAKTYGLEPTGDGWYGPLGLYGIERGPDGLLRAVASNAIPPAVGVSDDVAEALMISWCPHAYEVQELLDEVGIDEAVHRSASFVRSWNVMAEGTAKSLRVLGLNVMTSLDGEQVIHPALAKHRELQAEYGIAGEEAA